jgi:Zinc finger, C2H2 type
VEAVIPKTEPTDEEASAPTVEIKEEVVEETANSILEPSDIKLEPEEPVESIEPVVEMEIKPEIIEDVVEPPTTPIKQELSDIVEQIKDSSVPKTKNRKYPVIPRPLLAKDQLGDRVSCHICGKTNLRNGHHLSQHIKQRHSSQTFPCDECPKVYVSKVRLRTHKRFLHELKISYDCDQCQRTYQNRKSLQIHKLELHYDGPLKYKCNICDRKFRHPDAAEYHVKMHRYKQAEKSTSKKLVIKSKKRKCTACKIMHFESAQQHRTHVEQHGRNYRCEECMKVFISDVRLRVHINLTHSKETVGCDSCEFRTKYPQTMKRHMKKHKK